MNREQIIEAMKKIHEAKKKLEDFTEDDKRILELYIFHVAPY